MASSRLTSDVGAATDPVGQTLTVERCVPGGDGLARCEDGRIVFVPGAFAGDVVRLQATTIHSGFVRATQWETRTPSPERRAAPCPIAARCGGCDWMSLEDAAQGNAKLELLQDALIRVGQIDPLPPLRLTRSAPLGYRSRLRLHVSPEGGLGLLAKGTHQLVDVASCAVASDGLNTALTTLRTLFDPKTIREDISSPPHRTKLPAATLRRRGADGAGWSATTPIRACGAGVGGHGSAVLSTSRPGRGRDTATRPGAVRCAGDGRRSTRGGVELSSPWPAGAIAGSVELDADGVRLATWKMWTSSCWINHWGSPAWWARRMLWSWKNDALGTGCSPASTPAGRPCQPPSATGSNASESSPAPTAPQPCSTWPARCPGRPRRPHRPRSHRRARLVHPRRTTMGQLRRRSTQPDALS